MSEYHVPVMLNEVLVALNIKNNGIYLDGTLGGGGHSEAIMRSGGKLIALDRDDDAIEQSTKRFEKANLSGYNIVKWNQNSKTAIQLFDEVLIGGTDLYVGKIID